MLRLAIARTTTHNQWKVDRHMMYVHLATEAFGNLHVCPLSLTQDCQDCQAGP